MTIESIYINNLYKRYSPEFITDVFERNNIATIEMIILRFNHKNKGNARIYIKKWGNSEAVNKILYDLENKGTTIIQLSYQNNKGLKWCIEQNYYKPNLKSLRNRRLNDDNNIDTKLTKYNNSIIEKIEDLEKSISEKIVQNKNDIISHFVANEKNKDDDDTDVPFEENAVYEYDNCDSTFDFNSPSCDEDNNIAKQSSLDFDLSRYLSLTNIKSILDCIPDKIVATDIENYYKSILHHNEPCTHLFSARRRSLSPYMLIPYMDNTKMIILYDGGLGQETGIRVTYNIEENKYICYLQMYNKDVRWISSEKWHEIYTHVMNYLDQVCDYPLFH